MVNQCNVSKGSKSEGLILKSSSPTTRQTHNNTYKHTQNDIHTRNDSHTQRPTHVDTCTQRYTHATMHTRNDTHAITHTPTHTNIHTRSDTHAPGPTCRTSHQNIHVLLSAFFDQYARKSAVLSYLRNAKCLEMLPLGMHQIFTYSERHYRYKIMSENPEKILDCSLFR